MMKKEKLEFWHKVIHGTAVCFSLMVLGYLILYSLIAGDKNDAFVFSVFTRYTLLKFLFLLLFSLCVGFLGRVFETKKPRVIARLIHFFGTFAAFLVFILYLMNQLNPVDPNTVGSEMTKTPLTPQYVVLSVVMFLIAYFLCVGLHALGRRILRGPGEKEFKSIFK